MQTGLAMFTPNFNGEVQPQINMMHSQEDNALYVGNLSPSMTDPLLYQYFQPYGKIASAKIKTSHYTGESRGFAFVNYVSLDDARKAKEALNHSIIMDREVRICFKREFKNLDPEANVYVKNISSSVRGKQMEDEFAPYGAIFSCTVKYDENGKHLGYGYVQYKEKESADKAIEALNGANLLGSTIQVEKFKPRGKRNIVSWKTNLYVKNFPQAWTKKQVEDFIDQKFKIFADNGGVSSICVRENEKHGRCFAFIAYNSEEDATKAMKTMNDFQVDNETLYVGYAQKKALRRKTLAENFAKQANETNLFIKSLKEAVTDEQLKKVFSQYGEVTSVAVQKSSKIPKSIESHGVKLNFGFINFRDENCAKQAFIDAKKNPQVKALISEYHDDKRDFLYFAQAKNVREQYLKMVRKNLQTTTLLQNQINFFKMMAMHMNGGKRGPQGQFNKKGKQAGGAAAAQIPNMVPPFMNMFGQEGAGFGPMMGMGQPMMMMPNFGAMPMMPGFNMPAVQTVAPVPGQAVAAPAKTTNKDLNWLVTNQSEFDQMDSDEKRKLLGNLMYYRVASQPVDKELVPKITGMLIDLDVLDLSDIIEILTKDESLKERIADAINIINEADADQ